MCRDDLGWLDGLDVAYPIKYARRDIVVHQSSGVKRASITKIEGSLMPDLQTIDMSKGEPVEFHSCKDPLVLEVPFSVDASVDASHMIFGISTILGRIEDSIPQLLRWLAHTGARLYVVVVEAEDKVATDPKQVAEVQQRMRNLGLDVTLVTPLSNSDTFSERYFSLVKIMYDHRDAKTKWISLMDDDTFFPSMRALVAMLEEHDPAELHYIGALSEDWWAVTVYGFMGFGGAGIFLSITLAEILDQNYDECKKTSDITAGDIRVMQCVYRQTNTKLTHIPALHQIDLHGDLSGIYESGRFPLSLHHWKGGGPDGKGYPVWTMHLVADVCGAACFLQRWQFGPDTVLANGFSIATYPRGEKADAVEWDKMEETWDRPNIVKGSHNQAGTDHSLGPRRPSLQLEDEKIQYRFLESARVDGGVRQAYVRRGVGDKETDTVLVLFWKRGDDNPAPPGSQGVRI